MRKLIFIGLVTLVLTVLSGTVFASDDLLGSLGSQISSGVNGLSKGDFGGVASGVNNFARTTFNCGVKMTGAQLNNMQNDLGRAFSNPNLYRAAAFSGLGITVGLAANIINQKNQPSGLNGGKAKKTYEPLDFNSRSSGLAVEELAEPGKGAFNPKVGASTIIRVLPVYDARETLKKSW